MGATENITAELDFEEMATGELDARPLELKTDAVVGATEVLDKELETSTIDSSTELNRILLELET